MKAGAADPPLFLPDEEIGRRILGDRAREFKALAPLLERRGFPKIDLVMGGRYWPAVRRFFDVENGLAEIRPAAPSSGREDVDAWRSRRPKRRA